MNEKKHIINKVTENSIAWELNIEEGDTLISINDTIIKDVFDYHFLMNDTFVNLIIRKPNGEEWELEIEKDYEEDIGLEFEEGLMDSYRSCRNKCVLVFTWRIYIAISLKIVLH